jgi:integrase
LAPILTPASLDIQFEASASVARQVSVTPRQHIARRCSRGKFYPSQQASETPSRFSAISTRKWSLGEKGRGKFAYFVKVSEDVKGEVALRIWLDQKDDLLAGRTPRVNRGGLTLHQLCNRFCAVKEQQADASDITRQTFVDYHRICKVILGAFGKTRLVDDLIVEDSELLRAAMAKRLNPNTLGNEVLRIRVAFNYAYDAGLIDKPIRYGPTFKRPAKRILRAERQKKGPRMFEARHIRRIIKAADQPLRAMIMLGINCGFGNHDCGMLPISAVDLRGGWINYPRPKTAIDRRCPLWPETVAALKDAIDKRRAAKDTAHEGLVFLTKYGDSWARLHTSANPLSAEMRKLLNKLKLHRPGLGFYALRHTFETIAGEGRDQVAVNAIMGTLSRASGFVRARYAAVAATTGKLFLRPAPEAPSCPP